MMTEDGTALWKQELRRSTVDIVDMAEVVGMDETIDRMEISTDDTGNRHAVGDSGGRGDGRSMGK